MSSTPDNPQRSFGLQYVANLIDHTLLRPDATPADIEQICEEAKSFGFFSVCVNSVFVETVTRQLQGSDVLPISVIGFPLGCCGVESKCYETEFAITNGAREIDMVLWSGALKYGDLKNPAFEIEQVARVCQGVPLKVIIETALLSQEQKIIACKIARDSGAQFVKTCTGFMGGGATVEDVRLMREIVGEELGVKASGGIRTLQMAHDLIQAGANRLGTSQGPTLLRNGLVQTY